MLSPSLFLPYVLVALVVTAVAARRAKTPRRKRWITIGLLAFFCVFAFIDDIFGGIQHKWLCQKEAGFFVYKSANLPKELFEPSGGPRFITNHGPDIKMLEPYVRYDRRKIDGYSRFFLKIDKVVSRVSDAQTGQLLGEHVGFWAWPSAFVPTPSHVSASRCFDGTDEIARWNEWDRQVLGVK